MISHTVSWDISITVYTLDGCYPVQKFFGRNIILHIEAISNWKSINSIKIPTSKKSNTHVNNRGLNIPYCVSNKVLIIHVNSKTRENIFSPTQLTFWFIKYFSNRTLKVQKLKQTKISILTEGNFLRLLAIDMLQYTHIMLQWTNHKYSRWCTLKNIAHMQNW